MGNHAGKRELNTEKASTNGETNRGESEKKTNLGGLSRTTSEDNEVFGEADANQNNGTSSQDTAVTDSKHTADPKNAWQDAHPADPGSRPHLIRLFSRDAPGREDNTFKDRPSESDELQTIQEDSAATSESLDVMASQKRPSQRHGSKYLATASTMDHARHGFLPRHRDTGILDSIGRFFGGDRGVPKRGSGKVPWLKPGRSPLPSHARSQPGLCNMYKVSWHHIIALDLGQVSVFSELPSLSCKTATVAKASSVLQMLWNVVPIEAAGLELHPLAVSSKSSVLGKQPSRSLCCGREGPSCHGEEEFFPWVSGRGAETLLPGAVVIQGVLLHGDAVAKWYPGVSCHQGANQRGHGTATPRKAHSHFKDFLATLTAALDSDRCCLSTSIASPSSAHSPGRGRWNPASKLFPFEIKPRSEKCSHWKGLLNGRRTGCRPLTFVSFCAHSQSPDVGPTRFRAKRSLMPTPVSPGDRGKGPQRRLRELHLRVKHGRENTTRYSLTTSTKAVSESLSSLTVC
ncbi:hypothetical protein H8959_001757 [Pygathrix nigripes]